MISYVIGILPLIKNLKQGIPDVSNHWYTDDPVALGMFGRIDTDFNPLTRLGLGRIYHLEPSKSVLIVHPENLQAGKVFGKSQMFKV